MYLEYNWYPEDSSILQLELKLKQPIRFIRVAMNFTVSKVIPAKLNGLPENCYPEEGGELEVESCMPIQMALVDDPNTLIDLTKEQRIIVADWLDYDELDKVCYKAWEKEHD